MGAAGAAGASLAVTRVAAARVGDGVPREPTKANVITPPAASATTKNISSRRLGADLGARAVEDAAATVWGCGCEAGVFARAAAGCGVTGAGGAGDTGDGAAIWSAAHRSHRLQTVPDSAISRPHDAQRFTCLLLADLCSRTLGERTAKGQGVYQWRFARKPLNFRRFSGLQN